MEPDRVVFNALITACGQSGAVDRAFDVLAEMRAETQPIDPDHITVGALIKACTNAGQVMLVCLFLFSFFCFFFLFQKLLHYFLLHYYAFSISFPIVLLVVCFS